MRSTPSDFALKLRKKKEGGKEREIKKGLRLASRTIELESKTRNSDNWKNYETIKRQQLPVFIEYGLQIWMEVQVARDMLVTRLPHISYLVLSASLKPNRQLCGRTKSN
jgi:hypothetical protein